MKMLSQWQKNRGFFLFMVNVILYENVLLYEI